MILVTGGLGYIGSHTVVELLKSKHQVVILDNLSNSKKIVLERIQKITGEMPQFLEGDLCDSKTLKKIFTTYKIKSVIHFAGLKAVGESTQIPIEYYQNNVAGTINLCREMAIAGIFHLVFSSSSTVYGDPHTTPIQENFPRSATNPYGQTKLMVENIIIDICQSDPRWSAALLRYFNPIGAHPSGEIGEDPNGIPNNLLPFISQVAVGRLNRLKIFGKDYPTKDGTGVRDYIHVVDLAQGHIKALEKISTSSGVCIYNLGTGCGYSVLEMVNAFENACGKKIPYEFAPRRPGDVSTVYADASKALKELNWKANLGLAQMVEDSWNWQNKTPQGFEKKTKN